MGGGGHVYFLIMIGGGSLLKYKMTGGGLKLHKGREIIVILNLLQWIFFLSSIKSVYRITFV